MENKLFKQKILIAGGSGFIGKMLEEYFSEIGFEVNILSRQPKGEKNFFFWNPSKGEMDDEAMRDVTCIINLGGVSIAEGWWTQKRKQSIINTRLQSTDFLFQKLGTSQHKVETFISASAVGYYGNHRDEWVEESSPSSDDFLGTCCRLWEESAMKIASLNIRTVIFRIGIVLSKDEGALPLIALPVQLFIGSPLGNGKQYISWIHYKDLCKLFLKAAEDKTMNGVFNAVSPEPLTNKEFVKTLVHILHRPFLFPSIPSFLLQLILGEKAITVTEGQRVSCKKILNQDFIFNFPKLDGALNNIYSK
ncbi:MAG: TIGR01777 family oxidoreductase [Bacteroidia bacterium]|nr:TIGR01777 family oxidoreductase [Bacteroidia bacterium]